jgi:hypothetical protein
MSGLVPVAYRIETKADLIRALLPFSDEAPLNHPVNLYYWVTAEHEGQLRLLPCTIHPNTYADQYSDELHSDDRQRLTDHKDVQPPNPAAIAAEMFPTLVNRARAEVERKVQEFEAETARQRAETEQRVRTELANEVGYRFNHQVEDLATIEVTHREHTEPAAELVVDGVRFRWDGTTDRYDSHLAVVRTCIKCGQPTTDRFTKTSHDSLYQLGRILETEPVHRGFDCTKRDDDDLPF